jgi:hypothetical protein
VVKVREEVVAAAEELTTVAGTPARFVGWMEADGRACPTSPILRISDSDIVLLPLELAAFSGKRNCSKSFLFREDAVDEVAPVWPLTPPL